MPEPRDAERSQLVTFGQAQESTDQAVQRYELAELLSRCRPEHRRRETDWGAPLGNELW